MAKVLVVLGTRTGQTKKIGEAIATALTAKGIETETRNVTAIKSEADLAGFDGYVFGAATYHGQMIGPMKTMLFLAEKAGLEGKAGGAFGAFGWSGEAPARIFETMENIFKMNMVSEPLRIKNVSIGGAAQKAQDYGEEIAEKLG